MTNQIQYVFSFLICLILAPVSELNSQVQTVGLFESNDDVFPGYTLLAPSSKDAYLIDNCGHWVHKWQTEYIPGASTYLLENGNLLRTCRIAGTFGGGGTGGRVELYDWDSNLVWGYTFAQDNDYHQHHDVEYLPNGNLLILAWEEFSSDRMLQEGRNAESLSPNGVWLEKILEVKPIGIDQIEVVWEWHVVDHLIQDVNPLASNYGVVAEHPEKINLNYFRNENAESSSDYIHANAIDYNADLDQILISSRNFSEIWVIDHSTNTAEAQSDTGGVSGKGGDLLYRFGNPIAYDRGSEADQKYFGQHDVKWVSTGSKFKGMISVFNNGDGRPEGAYSTVDFIELPLDNEGSYIVPSSDAFGPIDFAYSFGGLGGLEIFSPRTSGAFVLPNDNIIICEGSSGVFYEIDEVGKLQWKYGNPVSPNGVLTQGSIPNNVGVFRAEKYSFDYPAFENKTLESNGPIELNPIEDECTLSNVVQIENPVIVINTLWQDQVEIRIDEVSSVLVTISNNVGKDIMQREINSHAILDVSHLGTGMYVTRFEKDGHLYDVLKSIKQ